MQIYTKGMESYRNCMYFHHVKYCMSHHSYINVFKIFWDNMSKYLI